MSEQGSEIGTVTCAVHNLPIEPGRTRCHKGLVEWRGLWRGWLTDTDVTPCVARTGACRECGDTGQTSNHEVLGCEECGR